MEQALARVQGAAGDLLHVVAGGEVALDQLDRPIEELRRFCLGGGERYLLVETRTSGGRSISRSVSSRSARSG